MRASAASRFAERGVRGAVQRSLFESGPDEVERIELPDAELSLWPSFLPARRADRVHAELRDRTPWQEESLVMFGREVKAPRLTAWYGDPGRSYVYSGIRHEPIAWTPLLAELRDAVAARVGRRFNSVLLNYYRDGRDSVAWHADDERELGPEPVIASLSVGAPRVFQLKHATRGDLPRVDLTLGHGSLLLMGGACQRRWRHRIPKRRAGSVGGRVNLTFREILGHSGG